MTMLHLIQDQQAELICGGKNGGGPKPPSKPGSFSFEYTKSYDFAQVNNNTVNTTYTPGPAAWTAFGNEISVSQINAIGSMFG